MSLTASRLREEILKICPESSEKSIDDFIAEIGFKLRKLDEALNRGRQVEYLDGSVDTFDGPHIPRVQAANGLEVLQAKVAEMIADYDSFHHDHRRLIEYMAEAGSANEAPMKTALCDLQSKLNSVRGNLLSPTIVNYQGLTKYDESAREPRNGPGLRDDLQREALHDILSLADERGLNLTFSMDGERASGIFSKMVELLAEYFEWPLIKNISPGTLKAARSNFLRRKKKG